MACKSPLNETRSAVALVGSLSGGALIASCLDHQYLTLELGPGPIVVQRAGNLGPFREEGHVFSVGRDPTTRYAPLLKQLEPVRLDRKDEVRVARASFVGGVEVSPLPFDEFQLKIVDFLEENVKSECPYPYVA